MTVGFELDGLTFTMNGGPVEPRDSTGRSASGQLRDARRGRLLLGGSSPEGGDEKKS